MGRKKDTRKRIGHREQGVLDRTIKHIRTFKVFWKNKKKGETRLNDYLIDHLRQAGLPIENTSFLTATFLKETFRPDCFIAGASTYNLLAVECKKVTNKTVKSRWKEGLAQCLLYTQKYKYVVFVLYDYTTTGFVTQAFGKGRKAETTFAKLLRKSLNIEIVSIAAQ